MAATSALEIAARAAPRAMPGLPGDAVWVALGAAALLWPAVWNGFPVVFADTGTYLSQAMRGYAGWDRPPVYSVLLRAAHWDRWLWAPVMAQTACVALAVRFALRNWAPDWPGAAVFWVCGALSATTALGVVASRLLPDVFAGVVVVLLLGVLWGGDPSPRCSARWSVRHADGAGVVTTGVLIATHQSYLPLAWGLIVGAWALGCGWRRAVRAAAAPVLAAALLVGINVAAFGMVSLSPFGSVFLLARAIEDGPGRDVLARDCPDAGWRLCGRALPATADGFLWRPGALMDAGGPKVVVNEAGAIVRRAWRAEPGAMLTALARNATRQAVLIGADDGLGPAPEVEVALRAFPAGQARDYAASRQAAGRLEVPDAWRVTQALVAAASVAALLARAARGARLAALVLLALAVNAAVTGGLSGPHARYQSRIVWLAPLFAILPGRRA